MAGSVDEFREGLRKNYNSPDRDRRDSILFRYLKKERDEGRRNQKNDLYSRLEECFAAATDDSEEGRRAYFLQALELLEKSRKPLLPGARKGKKDSKELLLGYAKKAGEKAGKKAEYSDLTRAKRWNKKVCKKLLEFLDQNPHFSPPKMDFLRTLHEELTDALLLQEAEDYLYNLENGRKNNRDLAILEEYLDATEGKGSSSSGSALHALYKKSVARKGTPIWDDKEKLQELQKFYEALQKEDYSGVVIPICIDSRTGAGLYFLGRDLLEKVDLDSNKFCYIACLYMVELELEGEMPLLNWSIWGGGEEDLKKNCGYPNVNEAVKWFKNLVIGKIGDSPQEYFRDVNGDPPPKNCPEEYLYYFDTLQKDDLAPEKSRKIGQEIFFEESK